MSFCIEITVFNGGKLEGFRLEVLNMEEHSWCKVTLSYPNAQPDVRYAAGDENRRGVYDTYDPQHTYKMVVGHEGYGPNSRGKPILLYQKNQGEGWSDMVMKDYSLEVLTSNRIRFRKEIPQGLGREGNSTREGTTQIVQGRDIIRAYHGHTGFLSTGFLAAGVVGGDDVDVDGGVVGSSSGGSGGRSREVDEELKNFMDRDWDMTKGLQLDFSDLCEGVKVKWYPL